jgi:hypothetical protein
MLRRPPGRSLRSYRPPQDLPKDFSRLARVRVRHARIAPSGGGPGRRMAERASCCTLRRGPGLVLVVSPFLGTGPPSSLLGILLRPRI